MDIHVDCFPCFVRQVVEVCRMTRLDDPTAETVIREALRILAAEPHDCPPPHIATKIHRMIRERTGLPDPYLPLKREYNARAAAQVDGLRGQVAASPDPFETAVRIALAGNIIDFGIADCAAGTVPLEETIQTSLATHPAVNHIEELRAAVLKAERILYLGDNTGEIFLDRLLVEQLPPGRVTFAVRGRPILNDATREDAIAAGIDTVATLIDNGHDSPGTDLAAVGAEFRTAFDSADVIISKGQGNLETLTDCRDKRIFFLLKVKCPVVSRILNAPLGGTIVLDNRTLGAATPADTTAASAIA